MTAIHIGDTFGRWTVIGEPVGDNKTTMKCLCKCSCKDKTIKNIRVYNLLNGDSTSCGCFMREQVGERFKSHGESKTRLYHVWLNMKARCNNPNNSRYERYGGRGIKVCDEWNNDFLAFKDWAYKNGYDENAEHMQCTIDRIDNDKGYSPDNCRWSTNKEQCNNRKSNIVIEYNGEQKTATEWAKIYNLEPKLIQRRYREGKSVNELFEKNLKYVSITYKGETHTFDEWSKITGIKKITLKTRYYRGYPIEKVLYQGDIREKKGAVV